MPLVKNEQELKQQSDFLDYEADNILILKSNVYTMTFHYLDSKKTSVACMGNDCVFCQLAVKQGFKYYYAVQLNGKDGIMNIRPSVFYTMNRIEKTTKKNKRTTSWLVIKEGTGKEARYTASKDEPIIVNEAEVELNNDKLERICSAIEMKNEDKYRELVPEYEAILRENQPVASPQQKSPQRVAQVQPQVAEETASQEELDVNPDDIPF